MIIEAPRERTTFIFWNIEGMLNATRELNLRAELGKADIYMFVETMDTNALHIFDGFYTYTAPAKKPRRGRPIGGITVTANKNTIPSLVSSSSQVVVMSFRYFAERGTVLACYFNPLCTIDEIMTVLMDVLPTTGPCVVVGDFNCKMNSQKGEMLVEFLDNIGFSLANDTDTPTYICHNGTSVIDLIFHREVIVTSFQQLHCQYRKHRPLRLEISNQYIESGGVADPRPKFKRKLDLAKAETALKCLHSRIFALDASTLLEMFTEALLSAMTLSNNNQKCYGKPWMDMSCVARKRESIRLSKEVLIWKTRHGVVPDGLLREYSEAKRLYKKTIREARCKSERQKELNFIRNVESSGSVFKLLRPHKQASGSGVSDEKWKVHFTDLYNPDYEPHHIELNGVLPRDSAPCMTEYFREHEIMTVVKKLKKGKSSGLDGILSEHLQQTMQMCVPIITGIVNAIWEGDTIPQSLLKSLTVVLYKGKGSRDDPNNYRGIALISVIRKVITGAIYNRLYLYAEENGLLPQEQYGFRRKRSTLDAVQQIMDLAETHASLYVGMVDLTKAFDRVNRYALGKHLKNLGINGNMLECCVNLLQSNLVKIYDGVNSTQYVHQAHGVMQGDKLSPLLFILYTSDLPGAFTKCDVKCTMYADDVAMTATNRGQLQEGFDSLAKYCDRKDLNVNVNKTKILIIRRARVLRAGAPLTYKGKTIEIVNDFEYLGITLQCCTWSFTKHTQKRVSKAKSALFALNNQHRLTDLAYHTCETLFQRAIVPIATYGIQLTQATIGERNFKEFESLGNTFMKLVCGLPQNTSHKFLNNIWPEYRKLCCQINSDHMHEDREWGAKENQGWDLYREEVTRSNCIASFVDVRSLRGHTRRNVAVFSLNGFHRKWAKCDDCVDARSCVGHGVVCKLCDDFVTGDLYHMLNCTKTQNVGTSVSIINMLAR